MIETWTPRVGRERACAAFGVPSRTLRHRRQQAQGRGRPRPSRASGRPRTPHPARIDDAERARIVGVLCEPRFVDLAPAQVYATLLDESVYLFSIRQMYRLLHERDLVHERRRGHALRKVHTKPRVHATEPNQVWSWDISRLAGPGRRDWFYAYVLLDIFSRAIVGHTIDTVESDQVAERLIAATATRQGIDRGQLVLHSDRGPQGVFNWSSQHHVEGGCRGTSSRVDDGVDGQVADEVAGCAFASARGRAGVLAGGRNWGHYRTGGGRGQRVRGGGLPLVPARGRDAADGSGCAVRPVSVVS